MAQLTKGGRATFRGKAESGSRCSPMLLPWYLGIWGLLGIYGWDFGWLGVGSWGLVKVSHFVG
jgi:hypothetical protein